MALWVEWIFLFYFPKFIVIAFLYTSHTVRGAKFIMTGTVLFLSACAYFVHSCLGYCPFRQRFFPQLWTFLNVLRKKLKGIQPLKQQNNIVQILRYSKVKYKHLTQYQAQSPIQLYLVSAHLTMTVNSQPQTCYRGKEQTFLKLNHDHGNLHWRRSATYYNMHVLVALRDQFCILQLYFAYLI